VETDPAPWIQALRHSHDVLRATAEPLTEDQLRQRSYASEWSIAQVLSHLGSQSEIFGLFLDAGLTGQDPPGMEQFVPIWDIWNAKGPQAQADDALLADVSKPLVTPHSRQNGLSRADLARRGYRILTHSTEAGVDAFTRVGQARALFLQGHPEYDSDTLMREYARDVGRFLRGERPVHPVTPSGYFDAATEAALAERQAAALAAVGLA